MQLDARDTIRGIENHAKQVAYATMIALNLTAEDGNAAIRQELPRRFHVRKPGLLRFVAPQQLPAHQRATKQNLNAILKTEGLGHIFDPFETGMPKRQKGPDTPLAIPTRDLRFTPKTVVPPRWFPRNLGLVKKGHAIRGKRRTFVLDTTMHGISPKQRGVYVRVGDKPEDIRMIWQYRSQVPRPASLHFEQIARRVFAQRYAHNFAGALAHALATAR